MIRRNNSEPSELQDEECEEEQVHSEEEEEQNLEESKNDDFNVIPPEIKLFDIKTPRLQHLFNKEFENFERSLTHFKKTNTPEDYKNELKITFWLAVEEEAFDYA